MKNKFNLIKKIKNYFNTSRIRGSRGFSLIELLVVVAIMVIVTTAVLFRQSKFSSDILITNMAYEVALAIREAEIYGISSKGDVQSADNNFKVGYGVHFGLHLNTDGKSNRYFMFVDEPVSVSPQGDALFNYFYQSTSNIVEDTIMAQGNILRFCGIGAGVKTCVQDGLNDDMVMNIVFVKPNPEAHITMGTMAGSDGVVYGSAIIVVESALGDKCRTIRVDSSGQVSVDPVDPASTNGGCDVDN